MTGESVRGANKLINMHSVSNCSSCLSGRHATLHLLVVHFRSLPVTNLLSAQQEYSQCGHVMQMRVVTCSVQI